MIRITERLAQLAVALTIIAPVAVAGPNGEADGLFGSLHFVDE
ncbi:MAG: hypothetical protein ACREH8_16080 [Opitutaceae bacterium]